MSQPTDFDAFLSDWLADDGPAEVPARVAAGAIASVRTTAVRTRTRVAPRRLPHSWRPLRLLVAVGALIVLAVAAALAVGALRPSPAPLPPTVERLPGNGRIVASEDGDVILVDPVTGAKQLLTGGPDEDTVTSVAPDGSAIAWWRRDGVDGTWSLMVQGIGPDADGSAFSVPSEQPGEARWAPASDRIAAVRVVNGTSRLSIVDREGREVTAFPDLEILQATWRPDGKALAVWTRGADGAELALVPATGGESVGIARSDPTTRSGDGTFDLFDAAWSPDGRSIAAASTVAARTRPGGSPALRVFVMDADGTHARMLEHALDATGEIPVGWSADGHRLLVRSRSSDADTFVLLPVDGSPGQAVAELAGTGWHTAWSPDERSLAATRRHELAAIIDLETGVRTTQPWSSGYDFAWQPIPPE